MRKDQAADVLMLTESGFFSLETARELYLERGGSERHFARFARRFRAERRGERSKQDETED